MIDGLLIHRCTIQARTPSSNTLGEVTYSWATDSSGVHCRFTGPSGKMRRLESGEFVESLPLLFLKSTETIAETNRVVGTTGFTNTYEVLKVKDRYNGNELHHYECELRMVV